MTNTKQGSRGAAGKTSAATKGGRNSQGSRSQRD